MSAPDPATASSRTQELLNTDRELTPEEMDVLAGIAAIEWQNFRAFGAGILFQRRVLADLWRATMTAPEGQFIEAMERFREALGVETI